MSERNLVTRYQLEAAANTAMSVMFIDALPVGPVPASCADG